MFLLLASATLSSLAVEAENIPILRTRSKVVTVIDGDHKRVNYWHLMPDRNPDIYYVEIPMKPHTVIFQSDLDSIAFDTTYGKRHDFIIMLNGEAAYPTQIRVEYRSMHPYTRTKEALDDGPDVIPFRLGERNEIYLDGKLNGGELLALTLDLGAGGSVVNKDSLPKINMRFDGTASLINSDGNHAVPASSSNRLEIAGLRWEGLPFVVAQNIKQGDDGLVGNSLFQGKVIEINYDQGNIRIHSTLPPIDPTYTRHPILIENHIPYIHGSFTVGEARREGWFMFDTGAWTSRLPVGNGGRVPKLLDEFRKMAGMSGPQLTIGSHTLTGFNYRPEGGPGDSDRIGVLGRDLLKRFNTILDNQNGYIYLQPNHLLNQPYRNPDYVMARIILVFGGGLAFIIAWWGFKRREKRRA
ncbi:MAG TPA: aspartyl protease family protein [Verrucomicrobiae bacterium]|nr:aspartyl protease family protein [Verrucomicrobiae bacterium]